MANFNSKNDKDGFSGNDKYSPDECFELNPETLEQIAGGVGGCEDFDTYRYWRDQNGVLREIR